MRRFSKSKNGSCFCNCPVVGSSPARRRLPVAGTTNTSDSPFLRFCTVKAPVKPDLNPPELEFGARTHNHTGVMPVEKAESSAGSRPCREASGDDLAAKDR